MKKTYMIPHVEVIVIASSAHYMGEWISINKQDPEDDPDPNAKGTDFEDDSDGFQNTWNSGMNNLWDEWD